MREFLRKSVIAGIGCFALLQIIPLYPRTNPQAPAASAIRNQLEIPPEMDTILRRSCWNCHSNDTRWPWYSHVAPVSWLIVRDVNKARGIMNFSSWTEKMGEKLQLAVGMLSAACTDVTVGRMPKPEYVFLHSEAMLSDGNKREFCSWTQREGGRLLVLKRKNGQNGAAE